MMNLNVNSTPRTTVAPKTKLIPSVMPKSLVRLHVLGDMMRNFGATEEQTSIAQQGFSEGLMEAFAVEGIDANGHMLDRALLSFAVLNENVELTLDTSDGRCVTEAFSLKLAKALEYSVQAMRRKNLSVRFIYYFSPHVTSNPEKYRHVLARFGLVPATIPDCPPGMMLRPIVTVRPGRDTGITFSHESAWKTR